MKIESFMQALKEYQRPLVFNPWRDYDPECDISSAAPSVRAANLTRYLELRQKAHYLFIAEGLGYQGGHFSGMAMTSERISFLLCLRRTSVCMHGNSRVTGRM